jgi:hypothetical protein
MNKTNLILATILFAFTFSYGQQKDTIYGKVKSIREKVTFVNDKQQNYNPVGISGDYGHSGWNRKTGKNSQFNNWWYNTSFVHYINYYKEFDKKNNLLKEEWYFKNQNIVISYLNTFNELGDLILQKVTDNRNGYVINDYDYYSVLNSYDKDKNLIFSKTSQSNDSYSIASKKFDSLNRIKSDFYYNSLYPKESRKTDYIYDINGNLIEIKKYEGDNETYGKKYEYDNNNRKIKIIFHSPFTSVKTRKGSKQKRTEKGSDNLYQVFGYDEKDRIIETQTYNQNFYRKNLIVLSGIERKIFDNNLLRKVLHYDKNDSLLYYEKYEDDVKNRITKKIVRKANQTENTRMLAYTYSTHHLPIKLIYEESGKRTEIDFEYEFDSKDNWVKQTKIVNGKKLYVWTRKIEYFE